MATIIHLSPTGKAPITRSIDVSCLAFDTMSDVRYRVSSVAQCKESRATIARVLRTVAQMLVSQMIAQPDTRVMPSGLTVHHAGRRAIELLDLAQELDDASPTKEGA